MFLVSDSGANWRKISWTSGYFTQMPCPMKTDPKKLCTKTMNGKKKAAYSSRVNQMEKSTFTPMVFSTFGGMGNECHRALQRAAGKIASKRKESYADVMGHISTRIRMCILRTVLMSVRGSRGTSKGTSKPIFSVSFNLIPGIEDLKTLKIKMLCCMDPS